MADGGSRAESAADDDDETEGEGGRVGGGIASQHNRGVKVKSGVRADLKRA
jgi:hypothetical protein